MVEIGREEPRQEGEIRSEGKSHHAMVCYCHRLTAGDLIQAHRRCGTLEAVQKETRAGTGCGGCRVVLHSLFGEVPTEINELGVHDPSATSCVKPGSRIMKGFIFADGKLESSVYSSNAIAPQLGECDSTAQLRYLVLNCRGEPVIDRSTRVRTNETFVFHTREENLPRPFFGMFFLVLDRSNFGASRFNISWSNGKSTTSTHENSSTGRPNAFLPIPVTRKFLAGPNDIYLALMNPHERVVPFTVRVLDLNTGQEECCKAALTPYASTWINANEHLFRPVLESRPKSRLVVKVETDAREIHSALTVYFFLHNRSLDLWSSNHL